MKKSFAKNLFAKYNRFHISQIKITDKPDSTFVTDIHNLKH